MLADLDHLSAYAIEDACANYRRDPANRFFPTPGQIIEASKGKFHAPPCRLQPFNPKEYEGARVGKLKPVGEILRENGFGAAAEKWNARS